MANFQNLNPNIRCFALVGQFLQAWSLMECSLHDAIGAALNIEAIKLQILCANIRFRDKLHIIASLIDVASSFSENEKNEMRKRLRILADYSGVRNMMAHDPFGPDQSKTGVEFLTVKAKGKFAIPNVVWSLEKFQNEEILVDERQFFENLTIRFKAHPLEIQNYSAVLLPFLDQGQGWFVPTTRTTSPALWDYLEQISLGSNREDSQRFNNERVCRH
jgi:hypothetical protein